MAEYEHLPLKRLEGELPRRKHGFGQVPKRDAGKHGKAITTDIDTILSEHQTLPIIEGIDPSLILKVHLSGLVSDEDWTKISLEVLSVDGDDSVVLFADDKSLTEFRRKLEAYQGPISPGKKNPPYTALIAAIDSVTALHAEDRIGKVLKSRGFTNELSFEETQDFTLDVELHRPSEDHECDLFIYRLEKSLEATGGELLSQYTGKTLILCRIRGDGKAIKAVLALPEVAFVDTPPEPDIISENLRALNLGDFEPGKPPSDNAVTIGVVDSGVNFGHPLLASVDGGSFAIPSSFSSSDEGGHGTSVASIAAFGDIEARAHAKDFDAQFKVASARVTDDKGKFSPDIDIANLMIEAVTRLHRDYGCRIINISLGDLNRVYDGGRVDPWTATLDLLARDLNVLIIVSAGNRGDLTNTYSDGVISAYPGFLRDAASRLIPPAIGVNVLAIGSIAHSNGLIPEDIDYVGVVPVCGREEPSPFTRTGPGVRGMIKPDLVDFGGTAVWNGPTNTLVNAEQKAAAGLWAFSDQYLTSLFRARSGTSFAAPNAAYKAGLLLTQFPNASANLLRTLLALSAQETGLGAHRQPVPLNDMLFNRGHGIIRPDEAVRSSDQRVVFYSEDELEVDKFAVYEVPIPDEFQTKKGPREIRVALAYDPPVRHSRADYIGLNMGWRLLRGTSPQEVFDHFRKWEVNEGDPPDFPDKFDCNTQPGSRLREAGTLQVGTFKAATNISHYGDSYYLAVWCTRRWAPQKITKQAFAVAVQLRHEKATALYQEITQPIRVKV